MIRQTNKDVKTLQLLTHRLGDAEVVGDVLVGQNRHRPQVMSPLMKKQKIVTRHLT